MTVLAFDIETVPDVDGGRRLYGLDGLSDADVMRAMRQLRRQHAGHEFLALHLHRVVAIAVVLADSESTRIFSLGETMSPERDLIERFFEGLDRYRPTLVSWNGGGFDLPVLTYRAFRHGLSAPIYWETGNKDQSFRYNNYVSRFHWRHVDLMDVLAHYQGRATASLDEVSRLIGLPGKIGLSGDRVAGAWLDGAISEIRAYCEIDALNTYLLWLRFEFLRGHTSAVSYREGLARLRKDLAGARGSPHLQEYVARWNQEA